MASTYVTTVSATYAQVAAYALLMPTAMDAVINQQSGKVQGILNGIDMDLYNPATNPGLAPTYR